MAERDQHTYRFRLELTLGPSYDYSRFALLRWMIGHLIQMRLDCPVPLELRVVPLEKDE